MRLQESSCSESSNPKQSASTAEAESSNDSDSEMMMVTTHSLSSISKGKWIVDLGATCPDREKYKHLRETQEVTLGDGHILDGMAIRTVRIETLLPDGSSRRCSLKFYYMY